MYRKVHIAKNPLRVHCFFKIDLFIELVSHILDCECSWFSFDWILNAKLYISLPKILNR